jgi:hypothetical protein
MREAMSLLETGSEVRRLGLSGLSTPTPPLIGASRLGHQDSSSSNALACFKSSVSKPSVNQP